MRSGKYPVSLRVALVIDTLAADGAQKLLSAYSLFSPATTALTRS